MPKMVRDEPFRLATTTGHVIVFEPGVAVDVPVEVVDKARMCGAKIIQGEKEPPLPKNEEGKKPEPQGDDRKVVAFKVFEGMIARNARDEWGATGIPNRKAFMKLAGYELDVKELQSMWEEFKMKNNPNYVEGTK